MFCINTEWWVSLRSLQFYFNSSVYIRPTIKRFMFSGLSSVYKSSSRFICSWKNCSVPSAASPWQQTFFFHLFDRPVEQSNKWAPFILIYDHVKFDSQWKCIKPSVTNEIFLSLLNSRQKYSSFKTHFLTSIFSLVTKTAVSFMKIENKWWIPEMLSQFVAVYALFLLPSNHFPDGVMKYDLWMLRRHI